MRIVLIGAFFGHIVAAYQLTRMNQKARPTKYQSKRDYVAANFASRTMRWTGIIVALFVVFHLADLTWGSANPNFVRGDPYDNLFNSFDRVPVAIIYIVAMLALGFHIFHGAWSMFQSLGLNNPRWNIWRRYFADRVRGASSPSATSHAVAHHHGSRDQMIGELDARIPAGPIAEKWSQHKFDVKLVNPANKRRFEVIVVGSGLAGAAAAATLGELGYRVKLFTFHDTPRRAHSIAAQGGINAAKNYPNDGDSVYRLFYDTVKGGDFRAREGNVYRLAEVSVNIIDQCVAQGVPFAREYGGLLDNRSFGGAQVSRTFYARGQTGQQLLLGAYQALAHQVARGTVEMYTRSEMLDLVVKDGRAAGIVTRDLTTGAVQSWSAHAVALCTGGYGNAYYLSTNAKASNVTAAWRAHKQGALFANPCFTQIHPTCIPRSDDFQSKLTLMSESLRNDGRVWIPKQLDDPRSPDQIPVDDRDYFLERRYPAFGNLVPRDVASRAIKTEVDAGRGVGPQKNGVYLDFQESIERLGHDVDRGALRQPLRDVRAHHRREPVPGPHADLPRHPLHDGRALGRLQPDEQRARALRARRGQLRRPGRQPPRGRAR